MTVVGGIRGEWNRTQKNYDEFESGGSGSNRYTQFRFNGGYLDTHKNDITPIDRFLNAVNVTGVWDEEMRMRLSRTMNSKKTNKQRNQSKNPSNVECYNCENEKLQMHRTKVDSNAFEARLNEKSGKPLSRRTQTKTANNEKHIQTKTATGKCH